ncbi:hypothetical protein OMO38_18645 [Chryseobacterium sp. 09-1422]|uniref:Uncharacterized protein n=1 Tax=Chryseobacterium kimseyorum TaxID=2984028 RepID=A0ABT3I3B0_9FLAO|nr:hypothetical protein [Chryseobacterium kimseyorum]MCW3170552.1 hypothetical protein [Chryseobacterium kimseyorum]
MKKTLISITLFSCFIAYSQIHEIAIFNNSNTYNLKGIISAGDTSGTNCGLIVSNQAPSGIEVPMGGDVRYTDYRGQRYSSTFPVSEWVVNDGTNPPKVLYFDDPNLTHDLSPITDWSTLEFDMKDSNGTSTFTSFIQNPNYPCASNPSYVNSTGTGLSQNVEAFWSSMVDPITGNTILLIIINDI